MEHAKKFALIPEHLMSKHIVSEKQLSELDKSMMHILKSSLEEHEKVRQYYNLLQKKMNMEEYNPPWKPPQETSEDKQPTEEMKEDPYEVVILNSVPYPMKKEALKALDIIKAHSDTLKWNDKGEILVKNELISKTNIADLFNIIFTHNKKKTHVTGIQEFLEALNSMNMPRHYIKNKHIAANSPVNKNVAKSDVTWLKYK